MKLCLIINAWTLPSYIILNLPNWKFKWRAYPFALMNMVLASTNTICLTNISLFTWMWHFPSLLNFVNQNSPLLFETVFSNVSHSRISQIYYQRSCVYVCVFIPFHYKSFLRLQRYLGHTWGYRSTILCCGIKLETSAKSLHLSFWIFHLQRQNSGPSITGKKTMIYAPAKRLYILT